MISAPLERTQFLSRKDIKILHLIFSCMRFFILKDMEIQTYWYEYASYLCSLYIYLMVPFCFVEQAVKKNATATEYGRK
jgi:hypothetical protein